MSAKPKKLTDEDIAYCLKRLITDAGSHPEHHERTIQDLRTNWPLLHQLIEEIRANP